MKRYKHFIKELNMNNESEIQEISLGKVSTTLLLTKLMSQTNKIKDKEIRNVLKTLGQMIFVTSLQHKKK